MNFGELKTQVANYMHRTDLTDFIVDFVELARTRINRDLRVREMLIEKQVTPTVNPFPVEDDFLEMRDLHHQRGNFRQTVALTGRAGVNKYKNNNIAQANPRFYSIDGLLIETAPGGIDVEFTEIYYAQEAEFVDDADTRKTLDRFPTIWLYASLIEGHSFTQDLDLMNDAIEKYTSELGIANQRADEAESGAGLAMTGASNWL